jgi:hypothetical protein
MRRLSALARDLALLAPIHRRKSAIFFGHHVPPQGLDARREIRHSGAAHRIASGRNCNRCATQNSQLIWRTASGSTTPMIASVETERCVTPRTIR